MHLELVVLVLILDLSFFAYWCDIYVHLNINIHRHVSYFYLYIQLHVTMFWNAAPPKGEAFGDLLGNMGMPLPQPVPPVPTATNGEDQAQQEDHGCMCNFCSTLFYAYLFPFSFFVSLWKKCYGHKILEINESFHQLHVEMNEKNLFLEFIFLFASFPFLKIA